MIATIKKANNKQLHFRNQKSFIREKIELNKMKKKQVLRKEQ